MIVCAWKKPLNEQKRKAIMNVRNGSLLSLSLTKELLRFGQQVVDGRFGAGE